MKLSEVAQKMYDLQEYCFWQCLVEHNKYCGYCPLWNYKDNECSLYMLYEDYQKTCSGKYPCDWGITKADIERFGRGGVGND